MENEESIREVITVEREWVQALLDLDLATIARILAEDYTQIQSDGSVTGKAEALASYGSMLRHWDEADSSDYSVRILGDTALLIGRWRARGINNGERFDYQARFLAVYVKRDGRWQLLSDQSTPIREATDRRN